MLDLEETAISKLPQSLVNLTGLSILNLRNCKNLVCFPSDFQKLKSIKEIDIYGCSRFSRLPENLNENEALEKLYMGGTAIKEVPSSLTVLKVLSLWAINSYAQLSSSSWNRCSLLKRAFRLQGPSTPATFLSSPSFSNLSSLVRLYLSYCNLHDESLSSEIGNLSTLITLDLSGNKFVEVPSGLISKLQKLEFLSFFDCPTLKSLPQLPSNLSTIHAGGCPSLKHYVRSQLLWEFIEQFECQTQLCHIEYLSHGWKQHILKDYMSLIMSCDSQITDFFMQPTRLLVISGSEVPSWFHNQNHFCAEDFSYALHPPTNVSFVVNEPDSFRLSEWWGIAVCLGLENDLESANIEASAVFWAYRVSKGRYSNSIRGCHIKVVPGCCHQLCIIYNRFSSFFAKQLQLVFFTGKGESQKDTAFKIGKCGWRVLTKEDVERWKNTRDEEDNNDEFIIKEDESISGVGPISSHRLLHV